MKLRFVYTLFFAGLTAFIFLGNSSGRAAGANQGNTGAPGDELAGGVLRTCQTCHSSGTIGVTMDISVLDDQQELITAYTPGQTYTVEVRLNHVSGPAPAGYGFQMVSLFDADNSDVASWSEPSSNTKIATASSNNRSYAEHNGVDDNNIFSVKWTAPQSGSGSVTIYACGNGVNGNGTNGGDGSAINTLQLSESFPSNIENLASTLAVEIFPNPVSDEINLTIQSKDNAAYQINIINFVGQVLQSKNIEIPIGESRYAMDLSKLSRGAYLLQVINKEGSTIEKIFKQ